MLKNKEKNIMKTTTIEAIKPIYTDTFICIVDGADKEINYRKSLPFEDYARLVSDVAYQVVNEETGYNPFVYDVALSKTIIECFTDFIIPENINEFYNSGDLNTLSENLISFIGESNDYKSAVINIDKLIDFKKLQLANKSEFDNLCKTLTSVILKLENNIGNSIDFNELSSFIQKMNSLKIDEKGIIDALVDKLPTNKNDSEIVKLAAN